MGLDPNRDRANDDFDEEAEGMDVDGDGDDGFDRAFAEIDDSALMDEMMSFDTGMVVEPAH